LNAGKLLAAVLVAATLAGCKGTHEVAWWKTHPAELRQQLAKCGDDPGELEHLPNCVNAKKAQAELMLGTGSKNMAHF
jgi:hypothetical protein